MTYRIDQINQIDQINEINEINENLTSEDVTPSAKRSDTIHEVNQFHPKGQDQDTARS